MNQQKIGKFIQERRKAKDLTQVELAEKLGVSNRTISKWENGNSLPDYSIFNDLGDELDVSINELLSGEKLTEENYQKKLEKNIVDTIDYNNKVRNNMIKKLIVIMIGVIIIYFLYKCFILFYFSTRFMYQDVDNRFPYNKEIYTIKIKNNGKANKVFGASYDKINLYVPKEFELVTDKVSSSFVMDNCDVYIKNPVNKSTFDSAILICERPYDNIGNLDYFNIIPRGFPYLNEYKVTEKYNVDNTLDLIKYYEKHYEDKLNIFTSSDEIKMKYLSGMYSSLLPSYSKFFYLEKDLKGYMTESVGGRAHYQALLYFYDDVYSISFFNNNGDYFNYEKVLEILNSIYQG